MLTQGLWFAGVVALALTAALRTLRRVSRPAARDWWRALSLVTALGGLVLSAPAEDVAGLGMFTSHMVQHLLLIIVVPVLLLLARDRTPVAEGRRPNPGATAAAVFALYAVAIVGTHLTPAAATVMRSPTAGLVERLAYLAAGLAFWDLVLDGERRSLAVRCGVLVLAMPVDTFTGVALMMKQTPIGSATLSDVHVGGAVMWFAGDGLMAALLVAVFVMTSRSNDDVVLLGGYVAAAREQRWVPFLDGAARTGGVGPLEEDAAVLSAYNAYLAGLAGDVEEVHRGGA